MDNYFWTSPRVRLFAAILIAIAILSLTWPFGNELRVLLAYDIGMATYIALIVVRMVLADAESTRMIAEKKEHQNLLVLVLAVILTACSLVGVGMMLYRSRQWSPLIANLNLAVSLLAVFQSWFLLHTLFAIHYARMYYDPRIRREEPTGPGPLEFPNDELPDFLDFMYFSFTIGLCYQVSDVTIRNRHVRRVALAHALLSFMNVTVILGLLMSIISNVVNSGS